MATSTDVEGVGTVVRANRDAVEEALADLDREALRNLGAEPDAVVSAVFTPAFLDANTDFPDLETFLDVTGAGTVWALGDWLDWVLDWHVLGNTRFWSWEWMVHAGVAVRATAAAVGPVRCVCGGRVTPITASAVEEPGRADEWVEFRCTDCDRTGRATRSPDGEHTLEHLERA